MSAERAVLIALVVSLMVDLLWGIVTAEVKRLRKKESGRER